MSLVSELKANDKKGLFTSDDTFVNYSTGILPLDYANGFWLDVKNQNGERYSQPITGIIGGTYISVVGCTGVGKSTLADQIAYNIIKDFKDGLMDHIDAERTSLKHRMIQVMGADMDDERIILTKTKTSIEDTLDKINRICEIKQNGGDLYKYDVHNRTYNGKTFRHYIPTVIVIDSLPSFNSKEYNVEDLGTNMDAARAAKDISRFYNNTLDRMQEFNITIITINHIRPKIDANPYAKPPAGLLLMPQTESLPRGTVSQYMSQNCFRINSIKSNMYTKEDNGFEGVKCTIQLAKTKTNFIGATVDAALLKDYGFDPLYSIYEYCNSIGLVQGRNPYLYIQGLETMKFNRKDFRDKFKGEDLFRHSVLKIIKPHLESLLGSKTVTEDDRVRYGDLLTTDEEIINQDVIAEELEIIQTEKKNKKLKVG